MKRRVSKLYQFEDETGLNLKTVGEGIKQLDEERLETIRNYWEKLTGEQELPAQIQKMWDKSEETTFVKLMIARGEDQELSKQLGNAVYGATEMNRLFHTQRSKAGEATAKLRKEEQEACTDAAIKIWNSLASSGRPERERCAVIAQRLGAKPDTIRRLINQAGLR